MIFMMSYCLLLDSVLDLVHVCCLWRAIVPRWRRAGLTATPSAANPY
eukprot:COSAG01_NODE_3364_length_6193_cov_5.789465_3_plen_47_part_00